MKRNLGFTLIELLIVMAILGVLAVVVLVAINPAQQLGRTRDAGRKSAVSQVGRALQAYYTTHGGNYLTNTNCGSGGNLRYDWMECLKSSGELSTPAALIPYSLVTLTCPNTPQTIAGATHVCHNNLWYAIYLALPTKTPIVYARMESDSEASKCNTPGNIPYFVWSTANGRGGLLCQAVAGGPPAPVFISTWDD